jgi:hypothetical protein
VSGRCYQITLPDGTKAIVRTAKRGWKPSPADLEMIAAVRRELLEQRLHDHGKGVDPDEGMGGDAVLDRGVS